MSVERYVSRCGCVVERHECGLLQNVYRCRGHQFESASHPNDSAQHYIDLGAIAPNGIPQHGKYVGELLECLGEMGVSIPDGLDCEAVRRMLAVEVGAGLAMYAPLFLGLGYRYEAVEPVPYPAEWATSTFCIPVSRVDFAVYEPSEPPAAIIAAHVVEHLPNAPEALARMCEMLAPGGRLYMIVPDNSDLWNPEHVWYGDEIAWLRVLQAAGFVNFRSAKRQLIEREKFLYFTAERP